MKKGILKDKALLTIVGLNFAVSALIISLFLHNKKVIEEPTETSIIEKKPEEIKDPKLEIRGWMVNLDAWNSKLTKRLEPIELKSDLAEENFTLVNGKFVNMLAIEEEEDIPLEDWMLSPAKMMGDKFLID